MNAPSIDLLAAKGKNTLRFAVKTTGHGGSNVQWTAPFGWRSLFKGEVPPDFVIFVWFTNPDKLDECRLFVVPAKVVDRDVKKAHDHWHSHLRRDGKPRTRGSHVSIGWLGRDTPGNISSNFQQKWKEYEENWDQLE